MKLRIKIYFKPPKHDPVIVALLIMHCKRYFTLKMVKYSSIEHLIDSFLLIVFQDHFDFIISMNSW